MAYESIRLSELSPGERPKFWRYYLLVLVGIYVVLWGWLGSDMAMGVLIWLCIPAFAITYLVVANAARRDLLVDVRSNLTQRGYWIHHELNTMLIDAAKRRIFFLDGATRSCDAYDFGDIREWEHQWVNHTEASVGPFGNVRSRTNQRDSVLVLKTNNPARPLYKVRTGSHANGELWMAKLSALLNG